MKARTAQILMTVLMTALAGTTVLLKAQMTGGQARAAQAKAASAASSPAPAATAAPAAQEATGASSSAAPKVAGPRRDPFRALIQPKTADALPIRLPAGKPGLVIGQLTIQGIVRNI